jgi:hypothetical protein
MNFSKKTKQEKEYLYQQYNSELQKVKNYGNNTFIQ